MDVAEERDFPRALTEDYIAFLVDAAQDWQYQHGSLLKIMGTRNAAYPIGATLFPTNFPKSCFERALDLQPIFNKLYAAVAEDEAWLQVALQDLMKNTTSMASILWRVHCAVKSAGYIQKMSLGVFRSDYMLHVQDMENREEPLTIRQVEFNTFSVAGGAHGNRISEMHKYLQRSGAYAVQLPTSNPLPHNSTVKDIAAGLAEAHAAYGLPKAASAKSSAVLMVVQPYNINICDERPIQEALWDLNIPCYRVEFGEPLLDSVELTDSRELLYQPIPSCESLVEISVVYHRAGYDVEEYNESGLETRYQLESSRAIKCPSILCHLATLKIIQQKLAAPDALEHFLPAEEAAMVRATFAPMYPLDESDEGRKGRELALKPESAIKHVLKPCLEGGGHNFYRDAIPAHLRTIPQDCWAEYILMEMIQSPEIHNYLLSLQGLHFGPIISELGVFGTCLWQQRRQDEGGLEILANTNAGCSLKTKSAQVNEMSVVKGYGCFDSPNLV